jgi:glycosyl-4,4'-diaponeurosporenoate acyltransferase
MRVIFLPDSWTVLLVIFLWGLFQVGAVLICLNLPDRFFSPDAFFYKAHPFEKEGRIYNDLFHVYRWKHLLPDGSKVWKKRGFKIKSLDGFSEDNLNRFLIESVRSETTHWLAFFPFWLFWFFTPPVVPLVLLAYGLLANFPCIIAQRYNRPRVQHQLKRIKNNPVSTSKIELINPQIKLNE